MIIAERFSTGMTDPGEPVNAVCLNFLKAFDSVSLSASQEDGSSGIHLKITHWVEEFLKNSTFFQAAFKLGRHVFCAPANVCKSILLPENWSD